MAQGLTPFRGVDVSQVVLLFFFFWCPYAVRIYQYCCWSPACLCGQYVSVPVQCGFVLVVYSFERLGVAAVYSQLGSTAIVRPEQMRSCPLVASCTIGPACNTCAERELRWQTLWLPCLLACLLGCSASMHWIAGLLARSFTYSMLGPLRSANAWTPCWTLSGLKPTHQLGLYVLLRVLMSGLHCGCGVYTVMHVKWNDNLEADQSVRATDMSMHNHSAGAGFCRIQ